MDRLRSLVPAAEQEKSVTDLLQRVLPNKDHVLSFRLMVNPELGENNDTVQIQTDGDAIEVEGSSGVAVAWGVQRYLRSHCNCHFSWDGFQVTLPDLLPLPNEPMFDTARVKVRYVGNVCTFSYSYVRWDWDRWERYIDWMALNGVNFPLAHTGQESVWRAVWQQLGLSVGDIDEYFTGPAFLAWNRMGNLRKFGGPLSENWHQHQTELQKKILSRMTSLGMVPILPAFSGFVPPAFIEHFPNARTTKLSIWAGFEKCYTEIDFLDPLDPLFKEIGTLFMKEMRSVYGLYHAYSAYCFNEVDPASFDSAYLSAVANSVYSTMTEVDPDAIWVMQAWLFQFEPEPWTKEKCEALLKAVPKGRLLVLDLYSEEKPKYKKLDNYFGQPFVWNMLHNFGGASPLTGNVTRILERLETSFEVENMVGIGVTMEGIYQNYVLYQMVLDSCWKSSSCDAPHWLDEFVTQRYGQTNSIVQRAWKTLLESVYTSPPPEPWKLIPSKNYLYKRPKLQREQKVSQAWVRAVEPPPPCPSQVSMVLVVILVCLAGCPAVIFLFCVVKLVEKSKFKFKIQPLLIRRKQVWFKPQQVFDVLEQFLSQSHIIGENLLFQRDLIDVAREVLNLVALTVYRETTATFLAAETCIRKNMNVSAKDIKAVQNGKVKFEAIFKDLDQLLSFHESFRLGTWIDSARKLALTMEEADQNEENAKNQLTLWGPTGEILDYAAKQWSGLIEFYYLPRWSLFFERLIESLQSKSIFSELQYEEDVFCLVEKPFTLSKVSKNDASRKNTALNRFVQRLFGKYSSELDYVTRVLMAENNLVC